MQQKDIVGKVLTLKLKTTDFQLRTRAQTLSEATHCPEVMAAGIKRLLLHEMNAATEQALSLRLLGVRMSSLAPSSEVGQRRQATLTQMFSQAAQPKTASSTILSHREQEPQQSQREGRVENVRKKSDNTLENSASIKVEKANHSQKRTPSIENFLSKPKPERLPRTEVYECSVCEELVNVESLEEFNKHLDTCLEIHSSPSLRNSNTDNSFGKTDADIQKILGLNVGCKEISERNEIQIGISHLNNCESSLGPSTSSMKQDMLCPVCEQYSFSDVTSLNKHMDECLSKTAISELLQEGSQLQEAVRPLKTDISKNQTTKKRKGNAESHIQKKTKSGFNTLDRYFCS